MFTSRAEYRLLLREDNADLRLTEVGRELGLVDDARWRKFNSKRDAIIDETARLETAWISPDSVEPMAQIKALGQRLSKQSNLMALLRRPGVSYSGLMTLPGAGPGQPDPRVAEQLEIQAKYSGYIERQNKEVERQQRNEFTALPVDFNYMNVHGLSTEIKQKLTSHRPGTVGQASRISGVTPAAISLLLVHIRKSAA